MKAAVLKAPGILELDDLPDPECPKGGALIEVKACSVCGTDVKMLQKGHKDLEYPRILGHEIVGIVIDINDRSCSIAEGDPVQVWPGIACGRCRHCLRGNENQCERMKILGFNKDGGFAEQVALPRESVSMGMNLIDDHANLEIVSLAEPLACCLNGPELTKVSEGDLVLIIGGGPIGCLHAVLAELHDAEKIIIAERLENRAGVIKKHTSFSILDNILALREVIDSETSMKGVDVILMATPDVSVDNSLLNLLAPGGRICIFSGPREGDCEKTIDLRSVHYRELTIVGAYGCTSRQDRAAAELLASGALDVDWIITKRTHLDNILEAFDHSSERIGLKSVINGI